MLKFKVGDRVKLIKADDTDTGSGFVVGQLYTISKIEGSGLYPYRMENKDRSNYSVFRESQLELTTEFSKGDILVNSVGERQVLDIYGNIYFMSMYDQFENYGSGFTIDQLKSGNYKLKQEPEPVQEMTMSEVCEALGKTIKIKK